MTMLKFLAPVAIAAFLGWLHQLDLTPPVCKDDDTVLLGGSGKRVDPCSVFSDSYKEARLRFRKFAQNHGTVESLPVYEDLTMDIVVLEGSQPGLVIHSSGVHGVEGFAGSAVQVAFLQTIEAYENRPTVILVHAFNPYGMHYYRRWNENNCDLNRNCLTDEEWQTYAASHYNEEAYASLDGLMNPKYGPTKLDSYLTFWIRAINQIRIHGIPKLKAAMVGGQYYNQKGIFHGGKEREASVNILEEWIDRYLESHELDRKAVTWVDVHTGLGKPGEDTILPFKVEDKDGEMGEMVDRWFPDSHNPMNSPEGKQVSAGYEKVRGTVTTYFCRKFENAFCFAQEFGTVHNVAVAHALILENAAHHYLPSDLALKWARETTNRAFYTPKASWRSSVLKRGILVLEQAMNRSMALSVVE